MFKLKKNTKGISGERLRVYENCKNLYVVNSIEFWRILNIKSSHCQYIRNLKLTCKYKPGVDYFELIDGSYEFSLAMAYDIIRRSRSNRAFNVQDTIVKKAREHKVDINKIFKYDVKIYKETGLSRKQPQCRKPNPNLKVDSLKDMQKLVIQLSYLIQEEIDKHK